MKWVCVFCGANRGKGHRYENAARSLGTLLAERGLGLVYGAGNVGLMGILADAALAAGSKVIGVIPRALVDRELAHHGLTELHVVETMHQRKAMMADLSDAFLALPGGFGTCDELFEIVTWAQLGIHGKPIGLLNVDGFFDPMLRWIETAVAEQFIRTEHRHLLIDHADPRKLLEMMEKMRERPSVPKWVEPEER